MMTLNSEDADFAYLAMAYLPGLTMTQKVRRKAELPKIKLQHQRWLEHEYSSDLPVSLLPLIYKKAWRDGHSTFDEVESHYRARAEFARKIIAAAFEE